MSFNGFLAQKYDILQQQADTNAREAQARIENMGAQTGEVAANAASQRGLAGAQAYHTTEQGKTVAPLAQSAIRTGAAGVDLTGAQMRHTDATTGTVAPLAAATIGHQGAAAGLLGAQKAGQEFQTELDRNPTGEDTARPFVEQHGGWGTGTGGGGVNYTQSSIYGQPQAQPQKPAAPTFNVLDNSPLQSAGAAFHFLNDGTSNVPGQGDGTKDTTPAMLAPGEAVLNNEGAELVGRDTIEVINKLGLAHRAAKQGAGMGMPATKQPVTKDDRAKGFNKGCAKVPGYSKGTAKVAAKPAGKPQKSAAKAPTRESVPQPTGPQASIPQGKGLGGAGLLAALAQMSGAHGMP